MSRTIPYLSNLVLVRNMLLRSSSKDWLERKVAYICCSAGYACWRAANEGRSRFEDGAGRTIESISRTTWMAVKSGILDVANTTATSYSPEAVSANKDRVWIVVLTIPILLKSVFFINTCFDSICYMIKLTQLYPWAQGAKLKSKLQQTIMWSLHQVTNFIELPGYVMPNDKCELKPTQVCHRTA
jgi:hypothetical protein